MSVVEIKATLKIGCRYHDIKAKTRPLCLKRGGNDYFKPNDHFMCIASRTHLHTYASGEY